MAAASQLSTIKSSLDIDSIPDAILIQGFPYCDEEDLARVSSVNRNTRKFVDQVWPLDEYKTAAQVFRSSTQLIPFQQYQNTSHIVEMHFSRLQSSSADLASTNPAVKQAYVRPKILATVHLAKKTLYRFLGETEESMQNRSCLFTYGFEPGEPNKIMSRGIEVSIIPSHPKIQNKIVPFLAMARELESRAAPVERRLKQAERLS